MGNNYKSKAERLKGDPYIGVYKMILSVMIVGKCVAACVVW